MSEGKLHNLIWVLDSVTSPIFRILKLVLESFIYVTGTISCCS